MKKETHHWGIGSFTGDIEICYCFAGDISHDERDDFTLPSLFTGWNLTVHSDSDCTLVFDPDFDFYPLVTFKITIREVMVKAAPSDKGKVLCIMVLL